MKRTFYVAFVAMLTVVIASCTGTTPPSNPDAGGTYLVGEVYNLLGLSVDKAISQLEKKGYVKDSYFSEENFLVYSYESDDEAYMIALWNDNGVISEVEGTSLDESEVEDLVDADKWLTKKISYNLWQGGIDEKDYLDGDYVKEERQKAIDMLEELLKAGAISQEDYQEALEEILSIFTGAGNKAEFIVALKKYKLTDDSEIYEEFYEWDNHYQGMAIAVAIEDESLYCYAMKGDMSGDFGGVEEYNLSARKNPLTLKRRLPRK